MMRVTAKSLPASQTITLPPSRLQPNHFSLSIYGDPTTEINDLLPSIRDHGILVALVVAPGSEQGTWEVISGHRRLACAQALDLAEVPCDVRHLPDGAERHRTILEYNRQHRKTFSQLMREADAIEKLWKAEASSRRLGNLRRGRFRPETLDDSDRRNSADRSPFQDSNARSGKDGLYRQENRGRIDVAIARALEMGGKDLYRQARTIWRLAQSGDVRAQSSVVQLDAGTKTIHAGYKDLRRRGALVLIFAPRRTTYGPFATTTLLAFPIREPSRQGSSHMHFTTSHRLTGWWSIPWPGVGQPPMSASQWGGVALPTTFIRPGPISSLMIFATAFHLMRPAAT